MLNLSNLIRTARDALERGEAREVLTTLAASLERDAPLADAAQRAEALALADTIKVVLKEPPAPWKDGAFPGSTATNLL